MATARKRRASRSERRLGASSASGEAAASDRRGTARLVAVRLPGVVLLVACIWLLIILLSNQDYRVQAVVIEGTREIASGDIAEIVDIEGQSIFLVKADALVREIEARYGCIESVAVRCQLPGKVIVTIREKDVVLVWNSGDRYWWLGADGEVLGEADGPGELVVVRDRCGTAPEPATHVAGVPVALVSGLGEALPACRVYDYAPDEGLIAYVTAEMWPVFLGREGDPYVKAAILTSLVSELVEYRESVEYIDLRNERHPTYKPARVMR